MKYTNQVFRHLPEYIRSKFISKGITDYSAEYKTAFLKSTNAGVNWQKVSTFDTLTGYMNNIHFFDANTGYALIDSNSAGSTRLYKTTNAGVNWQLIRMVEAGTYLDNMHFLDLNTGFVSGIANIGIPFHMELFSKLRTEELTGLRLRFQDLMNLKTLRFSTRQQVLPLALRGMYCLVIQ